MRRLYWIVIFLAFLAGDIIAMQFQVPLLEKICKPLLVPVLILYFITS